MSQAQSPRRLLCGLALVLAACGDSRAPEHVMDVALQHALRATLTPGEAAIALDGSADFEVTVSGGADGPDSMWRCAVTNPEVASAAVTPTGCRASALTAGGAAIRATVTRGSETTSTTARLTVNAVPARGCPDGSPMWMALAVCEERTRRGYDRDAFGRDYSRLEDEIVASLRASDSARIHTPYTCTLFDIRPDGTAATDIEHIVALAEAYDSGLPASRFREFAADLSNLTIARPDVNRNEKRDRDAGEWQPPRNQGWFAARVVAVKQKYGLSVNRSESVALQSMLGADPGREVTCAAAN